MLKFLSFVTLTASFAAAHSKWHELDNYNFEKYIQEFSRKYDANEYAWRKEIFDSNLDMIKKHNSGDHSWKMGVSHHTDRTSEEMQTRRGYKREFTRHMQDELRMYQTPHVPPAKIADSVDWRTRGAVTPVKDQGQCGSCWTFATAEAVETAHFLQTGELHVLSEQQIASCTANPKKCGGTGGCEGGTGEVAMASIIKAGGLASEWTYPYNSYWGDDLECKLNATRTPAVAKVSNYVKLPENDYKSLIEAVNIQTIIISVDASAWSHYETGVFNGCNQTNPEIDHAVLLVGYGTDSDSGLDYWLVRNSWTPHWGEDGYIRILRQGDDPTCGYDLNPSEGTACEPFPERMLVCGTCGILSDSSYPVVG